jgi:hypothetical protein
MRRKAPGNDFHLPDLAHDRGQRHEQLVDLFGQYMFWMRNWAVARSRELIESADARKALGTVRAKRFDPIAALEPDERDAAVTFAQATVDEFCDLLLRLLGNEGYDLRVGSGEAVRLRLEMEFIDTATDTVVETDLVNRDGQKSLPDYWGRWLNLHRAK